MEMLRFFVQSLKNSWANKMSNVERIYGKGFAMRLQAEKDIMKSIQRFHGLPSSHVALETVLGTDTEVSVQDVLNGSLSWIPLLPLVSLMLLLLPPDPYENPDVTFRLHDAMEIKYGLL